MKCGTTKRIVTYRKSLAALLMDTPWLSTCKVPPSVKQLIQYRVEMWKYPKNLNSDPGSNVGQRLSEKPMIWLGHTVGSSCRSARSYLVDFGRTRVRVSELLGHEPYLISALGFTYHRVLQGAATRGRRLHFFFAILQTFFHATKWPFLP